MTLLKKLQKALGVSADFADLSEHEARRRYAQALRNWVAEQLEIPSQVPQAIAALKTACQQQCWDINTALQAIGTDGTHTTDVEPMVIAEVLGLNLEITLEQPDQNAFTYRHELGGKNAPTLRLTNFSSPTVPGHWYAGATDTTRGTQGNCLFHAAIIALQEVCRQERSLTAAPTATAAAHHAGTTAASQMAAMRQRPTTTSHTRAEAMEVEPTPATSAAHHGIFSSAQRQAIIKAQQQRAKALGGDFEPNAQPENYRDTNPANTHAGYLLALKLAGEELAALEPAAMI